MTLHALGWNKQREDLFAPFAERGLLPARVTRVDRGSLELAGADSSGTAVLAGRLRGEDQEQPAVGDWVAVETTGTAMVVQGLLPRTGLLSRQRPGPATRRQVAAANVDLALVVEGLDRGPNRGRIERGTALAWDGGATPLVVLTKTDLVDDLAPAMATAQAAAPFLEVLAVSVSTGDGLDQLRSHLQMGTTAVLLGPSGSGKTSLVNRLLGNGQLATGPVRSDDHRGRHTTTRRELVLLPGGGCVIDTPGVRELGLWLDAEAIDGAFADLKALAGSCRFRDCRHLDEPGCAVLAAVDAGELDGRRLDSWHKLRREALVLAARVDDAERRRIKSRDRQLAKAVREVGRYKGNR